MEFVERVLPSQPAQVDAFADVGEERQVIGPATVEVGLPPSAFGFDSTSRSVTVDWLMNRTSREVSGPSVPLGL